MTQQPKMPGEVFVKHQNGEYRLSDFYDESDDLVEYIRADIVEGMVKALELMIGTYEHEAAMDHPSLLAATAALLAYEEGRK